MAGSSAVAVLLLFGWRRLGGTPKGVVGWLVVEQLRPVEASDRLAGDFWGGFWALPIPGSRLLGRIWSGRGLWRTRVVQICLRCWSGWPRLKALHQIRYG
ncbi:unnamed protein product [Rhodiola kirilowii]